MNVVEPYWFYDITQGYVFWLIIKA